jgi:hypothetical protein
MPLEQLLPVDVVASRVHDHPVEHAVPDDEAGCQPAGKNKREGAAPSEPGTLQPAHPLTPCTG